MSTTTNLQRCSDVELSMIVFNTEHLYRLIRDNTHQALLMNSINGTYIYNKEQLITLMDDIADHLDEYHAEYYESNIQLN
jgi:hypothetical protein